MFKRVVWSCVTEIGPDGEIDEKSEVNLPLLKGLLNEIHSEIYIEDYQQRMRKNNKDYKKINIHDFEGFNDYTEVDDHIAINRQV